MLDAEVEVERIGENIEGIANLIRTPNPMEHPLTARDHAPGHRGGTRPVGGGGCEAQGRAPRGRGRARCAGPRALKPTLYTRKPRSKTLDPAPYALDLEVTTCKEVVSLNGEVVSLKAALHAVGEVRDAQVLTP